MPPREEEFEQLYVAHGPALYRFCLLQLGRPADAEDALQEVLCKRLYRAPPFASTEHERRWLFRVAVNQCRSQLRRRKRETLPLTEELPAAEAPVLGLLEAMARLPEKQRAALHLHYCEGYSVEELAKLLGVTVSAVKMRLNRGRQALRVLWKEEL